MANMRMFLRHNPSGDYIFLGKRMEGGWYGVPNETATNRYLLFKHAGEDNRGQDDFSLVFDEGSALEGGRLIDIDVDGEEE